MGHVSRYPEVVHVFVKNNCTKMTDEELARICNEYFGTEFTDSKMKAFRANHHYLCGRTPWRTREENLSNPKNFPKEMYEYVRDNSWHVSSKDLAERVNAKFGMNYTANQMKSFRQRYGIKSGLTGWYQKGHAPGNKGKKLEEYVKDPARVEDIRQRISATQFKKGQTPPNEKQIGDITIRNVYSRHGEVVEQYKYIKVSMEGGYWDRWTPLHRKVWEDHNGPIPKDMCIGFKDGNTLNCDINNLMLMSRAEISTMTKKGLRFEDPDLTETALYMVRLQQAANKRRKNGKAKDGD